MLAQRVKEAAKSDLRGLADEAGFRLARGNAYHCAIHQDRTPSCHLYDDAIHCFSCARNFDAIDLAGLITGESAGRAIRWLADRYGISSESKGRVRPRFSRADHTLAYLFRVGYCWQLERYLDVLKRLWALDEFAIPRDRILNFTRLLACAQKWSPYEAVTFYTDFRQRRPKFVEECIAEAEECQTLLATAIIVAAQADSPAGLAAA